MTDPTGYPHHLAGDPAPPPAPVDPRLLGMAAKAHTRHLAALGEPGLLFGAAGWPKDPRPAGALLVLGAEADAAVPDRSRASDGMIGDARHQADPSSDHNGWLKVAGVGVVRARDLTNDPRLDLPGAYERARARAAAGDLPQLVGGGYLILNGRITAPDFSTWRTYKGKSPHVAEGHVSVSTDPARFDDRRPWGLFSSERPAPAPVTPAPVQTPGWTGPDLTGAGSGLRGQAAGQPQGPQSNGPRVAALQTFLRDNYSLYAGDLVVDGWYGPQTARVLAEFAGRSGITGADGLNIGPQLAAAIYRAGFERRMSAARARVVGHVNRGARR
jgi:hypothetical protein